ncbi:MAG: tetratricopeptide repeat protein [Spirochaetales bacterium]|nr:tetratricopeptide repeat protein [Spirochaetales bacterium]
MGLVVTIIILGIGVALVAFFLLRSFLAPKRAEAIQSLLKQNKPQAAIKAAKALVTRDSRNADAHYLLGLAYQANQSDELALMEFQTVNQIGDFSGIVDEALFRTKIAALYANFNQAEEALKEYLLLIKREPDGAQHYFNVGNLFESRNRTDKAVQYYQKAIQLDGKNAQARSRLGLLLYRAKRPVEARAELDAAVRADPDNYEAWYCIGKILKDSKDCVVALTAFEKASRDAGLRVKSLIERGGCLISLGNMERAISELDRAARLADDDSNEALYARYFLAHAYEKSNRIELAFVEWEFIYRHKPDFKDVGDKMTRYQDMRVDDRLKDYLTVGQEEFDKLCHEVAVALGLTVRDTRQIDGGCDIVAVEPTSKWRNAKSMPKLLRFLRISDTIGDATVRSTHEAMRSEKITRGMIIASSSFSREASEFAESRPIDLCGKDQLQALLQKIDM